MTMAPSEISPGKKPWYYVYIGLTLGLLSTVLIGSSYIFKKVALRRLAACGLRAGAGGFQYLRDWVWWTGCVLLFSGEVLNFVGYAFAPAALVTPIGGLSVLVTAILSSHFLDEKLNLVGKIGCVVCLTGSTMVVLHAPKEVEVHTLELLAIKAASPGFLSYVVCIVMLLIILIFVLIPRYGNSSPIIYVLTIGSCGSLAVMCCKGIGIAFTEALDMGALHIVSNWIFWLLLVTLIGSIVIQLNYLNRALDIFNTSIVTPLLYVFFTGFVLVASAVLYNEWGNMNASACIGSLTGLVTMISGIILLTIFKNLQVTWRELLQNGNQKTNRSSLKYNDDVAHRTRHASGISETELDIVEMPDDTPMQPERQRLLNSMSDRD